MPGTVEGVPREAGRLPPTRTQNPGAAMTPQPDKTRRETFTRAAISGVISGFIRAAIDAILEHLQH